jgi:hypothetical protein
MVKTPREERLARERAQYIICIKLGKFDGPYCEYSANRFENLNLAADTRLRFSYPLVQVVANTRR